MPYLKLKKTLIVSLLPALIWGLSACGGAEESEAPAEATVAIEATTEAPAKTEENVATEPTKATGSGAPAQAASLREPAGPLEIAEAIDLREIPTLPSTASLGEPEIGSLSYQTSEKIPAVLDFYRPKLVEMGWEELPNSYIEETTATVYFTKGDFTLYLGASQMGEEVMVSLINHGNVDVRALPVYPEAEMLFADSATSSIYVTPAKVQEVVDFTREELTALGWHEYIRPNTSYADNPDQQSLDFIQNGLEVNAFIGSAPAQDGKTTNQYSVRVLSHALPVMDEASDLQFDEHEVYASYMTPADMEAVKNFYSQSLAEMGYELVEETNATDGSLLFSNDEMPLLVSFPAAEGDQTQVVVRRLEAAEVASLIGAATEEESETQTETETEVAPEEGGLSVFNLPSPEDATVNYEPESEQITVTSPSDIETLAEFYREALPAQGWQEETMFAMVEENFGMLRFAQDEASLDLTFFNDGFSGETEISISASGMAWGDTGSDMGDSGNEMTETELPEIETPQSEFTINDWPIPAEAEEVEIEDDEISYVIDWDFQQVVDFYAPTFEEWGLGDSCLEIETGFSSISCSTGANNISVSMNLFDNFDDKTEASFSFFGLAPAEIGGAESGEAGELSLSEEDGVPVPNDFDSSSSSSSEFMVELSGASAASVADLVALYREELPAQGWTEQTAAAEVGDSEAKLAFQGPESALTVSMSAESGETTLTLKHKMTAVAKAQGILPPAGQVRLYLGSMNEEDITVTLDGQALKVAPTPMDAGPKDTMSVDLEPGEHTFSLPGSPEETLELGADETWMLLIGPDGVLPLQVY